MSIGEILRHPIARGLALMNLGLVTLIVLRLAYPAATLSALSFGGAPDLPKPAVERAKAEKIPGAEAYAAIAERPLFIETRRMPKEEPPPAATETAVVALTPASALDGLTLSGIVVAGGRRVAIVKAANGESPPPLKEGDEFRGWRVERIEAEAAVFAAGDGEKRLEFAKGKQTTGVGIVAPR